MAKEGEDVCVFAVKEWLYDGERRSSVFDFPSHFFSPIPFFLDKFSPRLLVSSLPSLRNEMAPIPPRGAFAL